MRERVSIIVPDFDGCLYNGKYFKLIIEVLNRHWDFLIALGRKNHLSESEANYVNQVTHNILQELDKYDVKDCKYSKMQAWITHPAFQKRITTALDKIGHIKKNLVSVKQIIGIILHEFIGYICRLNEEIMFKIFLMANEALISHWCNKMLIQGVSRAALMLGTNRQSFYHDRAGMEQNGTGSCYVNLHDIEGSIRSQLKNIICRVSPFSMSDIYANLARGISYSKILDEYWTPDGQGFRYKNHACAIFDESKVSLLYAIVHDVVINVLSELDIGSERADITIEFYDNENSILEAIGKTFLANPQLIPDGVTLNLYPYDGNLKMDPIQTIQGKGVIDYRYRDNVKLMAMMCGYNLQDFDSVINVYQALDINKFISTRVTGREIQRFYQSRPGVAPLFMTGNEPAASEGVNRSASFRLLI